MPPTAMPGYGVSGTSSKVVANSIGSTSDSLPPPSSESLSESRSGSVGMERCSSLRFLARCAILFSFRLPVCNAHPIDRYIYIICIPMHNRNNKFYIIIYIAR